MPMAFDMSPDGCKGIHRIPGFVWMRGIMTSKGRVIDPCNRAGCLVVLSSGGSTSFSMESVRKDDPDLWVVPTDPASEGCLVTLLGDDAEFLRFINRDFGWVPVWDDEPRGHYTPLGVACVEIALGEPGTGETARWRGGCDEDP